MTRIEWMHGISLTTERFWRFDVFWGALHSTRNFNSTRMTRIKGMHGIFFTTEKAEKAEKKRE